MAAVIAETDALAVIRTPDKGRGVFARRSFAPGTLIERAPVILAPQSAVEGTLLDSYCYEWPDGRAAVATGFGLLYNHSCDPNARYECRPGDGVVDIIALRSIASGDEVLLNYNRNPADRTPILFAADGTWRREGEDVATSPTKLAARPRGAD